MSRVKLSSITKVMLNAMTSWETLDTPVMYVRYFEQCLSQLHDLFCTLINLIYSVYV